MPKLKTSQRPLDQIITLRVDAKTRSDWKSQAQAAGLPLSDWLRMQVSSGTGRHSFPKRRPPPPADPALLAAIGRTGNNLNQLARAANRQQWPAEIELMRRLINIERSIKNLVPTHDD